MSFGLFARHLPMTRTEITCVIEQTVAVCRTSVNVTFLPGIYRYARHFDRRKGP